MDFISQLEADLTSLTRFAKRHSAIKEASERGVYRLRSLRASSSLTGSTDPLKLLNTEDDYLRPFLLAANHQNLNKNIITVSLSAIQRIISHLKILDDANFWNILRVLSIQSKSEHMEIQLKVIQTLPLLFAAKQNDFPKRAVIETLKMCESFQSSKHSIVENAARATVRQVISVVFDRLEKCLSHFNDDEFVSKISKELASKFPPRLFGDRSREAPTKPKVGTVPRISTKTGIDKDIIIGTPKMTTKKRARSKKERKKEIMSSIMELPSTATIDMIDLELVNSKAADLERQEEKARIEAEIASQKNSLTTTEHEHVTASETRSDDINDDEKSNAGLTEEQEILKSLMDCAYFIFDELCSNVVTFQLVRDYEGASPKTTQHFQGQQLSLDACLSLDLCESLVCHHMILFHKISPMLDTFRSKLCPLYVQSFGFDHMFDEAVELDAMLLQSALQVLPVVVRHFYRECTPEVEVFFAMLSAFLEEGALRFDEDLVAQRLSQCFSAINHFIKDRPVMLWLAENIKTETSSLKRLIGAVCQVLAAVMNYDEVVTKLDACTRVAQDELDVRLVTLPRILEAFNGVVSTICPHQSENEVAPLSLQQDLVSASCGHIATALTKCLTLFRNESLLQSVLSSAQSLAIGCGRLNLCEPRDGFVNIICSLSLPPADGTLDHKHLQALRAVLNVSHGLGDCLGPAWAQVLQVLERFNDTVASTPVNATEEKNPDDPIDDVSIMLSGADSLFINSSLLPNDALIELLGCLKDMCLRGIADASTGEDIPVSYLESNSPRNSSPRSSPHIGWLMSKARDTLEHFTTERFTALGAGPKSSKSKRKTNRPENAVPFGLKRVIDVALANTDKRLPLLWNDISDCLSVAITCPSTHIRRFSMNALSKLVNSALTSIEKEQQNKEKEKQDKQHIKQDLSDFTSAKVEQEQTEQEEHEQQKQQQQQQQEEESVTKAYDNKKPIKNTTDISTISQEQLLLPFVLATKSHFFDVKKAALSALHDLLQASGHLLELGWSVILQLLSDVAESEDQASIRLLPDAFESLQLITHDFCNTFSSEHLLCCVKSALAFAQQTGNANIALGALTALQTLLDDVYNRPDMWNDTFVWSVVDHLKDLLKESDEPSVCNQCQQTLFAVLHKCCFKNRDKSGGPDFFKTCVNELLMPMINYRKATVPFLAILQNKENEEEKEEKNIGNNNNNNNEDSNNNNDDVIDNQTHNRIPSEDRIIDMAQLDLQSVHSSECPNDTLQSDLPPMAPSVMGLDPLNTDNDVDINKWTSTYTQILQHFGRLLRAAMTHSEFEIIFNEEDNLQWFKGNWEVYLKSLEENLELTLEVGDRPRKSLQGASIQLLLDALAVCGGVSVELRASVGMRVVNGALVKPGMSAGGTENTRVGGGITIAENFDLPLELWDLAWSTLRRLASTPPSPSHSSYASSNLAEGLLDLAAATQESKHSKLRVPDVLNVLTTHLLSYPAPPKKKKSDSLSSIERVVVRWLKKVVLVEENFHHDEWWEPISLELLRLWTSNSVALASQGTILFMKCWELFTTSKKAKTLESGRGCFVVLDAFLKTNLVCLMQRIPLNINVGSGKTPPSHHAGGLDWEAQVLCLTSVLTTLSETNWEGSEGDWEVSPQEHESIWKMLGEVVLVLLQAPSCDENDCNSTALAHAVFIFIQSSLKIHAYVQVPVVRSLLTGLSECCNGRSHLSLLVIQSLFGLLKSPSNLIKDPSLMDIKSSQNEKTEESNDAEETDLTEGRQVISKAATDVLIDVCKKLLNAFGEATSLTSESLSKSSDYIPPALDPSAEQIVVILRSSIDLRLKCASVSSQDPEVIQNHRDHKHMFQLLPSVVELIHHKNDMIRNSVEEFIRSITTILGLAVYL